MSATQNVPMSIEVGDRNELPVAAARRLFEGSCAFADVAGRATDVQGGAGAKFLGHVAAEADNRNGGAGAIRVVLRGGRYRAQVTLTGVALTDIGAQVFASANDTYALTSNGGVNSLVGRVVRYVGADTAIVEFVPVNDKVTTIVQQVHIANALAAYVTPDLDTEAELIVAINAHGAKINAILAALEAAGVLAAA
jgi:hypothetical protein